MNFRTVGRLALVVIMTLTLAAVCQACPTCKDGIADGPQQAAHGTGFLLEYSVHDVDALLNLWQLGNVLLFSSP